MNRVQRHMPTTKRRDVEATGNEIDGRIAAMRLILKMARPGSHAEALRALREAFPDASLAERVQALDP